MQRTGTLEQQAAVHPWLRWRLTHESQLPNVAPESDDDLALLRSQCASDPLRIHLATRFSLAEDTMHRRQTGPAARRSTRSWAGSSTSSRSEASGIEHSSSSQVRSDPLFSTGREAETSEREASSRRSGLSRCRCTCARSNSRPRRGTGRASHLQQDWLLRCELPAAANRARPAPDRGRRSGPDGRGVHRGRGKAHAIIAGIWVASLRRVWTSNDRGDRTCSRRSTS